MNKAIRVGFLGTGSIARSHAYALDALKYYYIDAPKILKVVAASPNPDHRESFANSFGFSEAVPPEEIWKRDDLDALYILGKNSTHTPQLLKAVNLPNLKRIYVEKPIGASRQDLIELESLMNLPQEMIIMVGFQFLQKSPIRKALSQWKSGVFGKPIHFRAEYLHSSYLNYDYRQMRQNRFEPCPVDGAAVDLGSHSLSMLTAFLGDSLQIRDAAISGNFPDIPDDADLCVTAIMEDQHSGAVGTLLASRVSAGTGDQFSLEIYGTSGAFLFNTKNPEIYETYLPGEGWRRYETNSDYTPASKFPSDYLPSGWLRALVHNHYLFVGGESGTDVIPDLAHGIQVQRLLQQIADHIHGN